MKPTKRRPTEDEIRTRPVVNPTDAKIQRGEHPNLHDIADMLDSGMELSPAARHYVALLILGKIKRPSGRILREAERTKHWRRDLKLTQAGAWIGERKAMQDSWQRRKLDVPLFSLDELIEEAAKIYRIPVEKLHDWWKVGRFR